MYDTKMKRLYHYTSVDTLMKIIRSKNLRFNNLTAMDDPEEAKAKDLYAAGRWIFTSSWTDLGDQRLMFSNYGLNGNGVCISLPNYPFYENFGNYAKDNSQLMNSFDETEDFTFTGGIETYVTNYNFIFFPSTVEEFKIIYTDNPKMLYPQVLKYDLKHLEYFDGQLGKCKNLKWCYQHEYRYRLRPTLLNLHHPKNSFDADKMVRDGIINKINSPCPISCLDIPVRLNGLQVILGSKIDKNKQKTIATKVREIVPGAKITKSQIKW